MYSTPLSWPARYLLLLRSSGLGPVVLGAAAGRLGYALLPLCLLFGAGRAMGSFALASGAVAVFGLATLAMPLQSRLVDLHGRRRVLPIAALLVCLLLATIALGAAAAVGSPWFWFPLCLGAGAVAPALGPAMRARWRERCRPDDLPTAYALDGVVEETAFLLGPVVAAGVVAVAAPWWGIAAAAVLVPLGAAVLAFAPAVSTPPITERHEGDRPGGHEVGSEVAPAGAPASSPEEGGPLWTASFVLLLLALLAFGLSGAGAITAVAALAYAADRPGVLGIVEAAMGAAAVVGGLWWGGREHPRAARADLTRLLLARVPLLVVAAVVPGLGAVGVAVALTGLLAAPAYVTAFGAADDASPPRRRTEASTWITTATNLGATAGTAAAGVLAEVAGSGGVLLLAAAVGLVGAVAAGRRVSGGRSRAA
ncbi:MFS transporter [Nocardioides fonticola]|uniref:MFS transporter n=1 Tax=Nocardioides fonticola TaxID=450363 RepID=A0ABP7XB91_9ACTN